MKKLLLFVVLLVAGLGQYGCSKDDKEQPGPKPEPVRLDKDTVSNWLFKRSFRITDAWRFTGNDSVDVFKQDTLLRVFANAAFLNFFISNGSGQLMFHSGTEFPNREIPGVARTFSLNIRIYLPTEMNMSWDEERGTLAIETMRASTYFPMIVPGKKGYLDPGSFNVKMSQKQAQSAAIKPSMRFIFEDDDPKLGKVTYKITMKPLYEYYREPYQQVFASFVMFP